MLTNHNVEID